MKRFRVVMAALLVICELLFPMHAAGSAEDGRTGYYAGENRRFSFELAADGLCYWYQDGSRYAGKYETSEEGFSLTLIGRGHIIDTSFRAEKQTDGSLRVYGGVVNGELFTKTEKTQDVRNIDQIWARRIRHSKQSSGRISLTETVLLDHDDIKITATEYSASGNDEEIRFLLENKGEQEITVETAYVLINDRAIDLLFFCQLAPHETSREVLRINTAALEAAGIERIETVSPVFTISIKDQSEFTSDAVAIPVQDSRNRVTVMIPIGKTILRSDKLRIELLGYENTGYEIELYYFIQNDAENGFSIRTTETSLNGQTGSPYAIYQDIEENSAMVYQGDFRKAAFSSTGKLNSLEFDLRLESSYNHRFVEFDQICMEFEPDGQLCAFSCNGSIYEESDFWQENYASAAEPEEKPADQESDWRTAVRSFIDHEQYDSVASFLKPYIESDPEAKILRAAFLSTEENAEEDYRTVVAELIDAGEDVVPLLEKVSKEVLGFVFQMDLDGMALNAYCSGDYRTAFSLAVYQARRASVFSRSLVSFSVLYCPQFKTEMSRIGFSEKEFSDWLDANIDAGDPVAMYVQAEINTLMTFDSDVDYYGKAAELLIKLVEGETIPQPSSNLTAVSVLNGLDYSTSNPLINFFIGECYRYGDGSLPQDLSLAEPWYEAAAVRGLPEAKLNYGHILLRKIMSDQVSEADYEDVINECYFYLISAADENNSGRAQYDLAVLFFIIGDMDDGDLWMRRAAENGVSNASLYVNRNVLVIEDWM